MASLMKWIRPLKRIASRSNISRFFSKFSSEVLKLRKNKNLTDNQYSEIYSFKVLYQFVRADKYLLTLYTNTYYCDDLSIVQQQDSWRWLQIVFVLPRT